MRRYMINTKRGVHTKLSMANRNRVGNLHSLIIHQKCQMHEGNVTLT